MKQPNPYLNDLLRALENGDEESIQEHLDPVRETDGFSTGFSERLMDQLEADSAESGVMQLVPKMFRWVAAAGIAASIALITLFYLDGSALSFEEMSGLSEVALGDDWTLEMY